MNKAAALLLLAACGGNTDPFAAEVIQEEMEERSLRELYDEAQRQPWAPPADGLLTENHLAEFLKVAPLATRIVEVAGERIELETEVAQSSSDRMTQAGAAFAAIGSARNAATAHLRAALMLGLNPNQQAWVLDRILEASWHVESLRRHEEAIARAEQARENETNIVLHEQNEAAVEAARQQRQSWEQTLGDAQLSNARLVARHADELARHIPALAARTRR